MPISRRDFINSLIILASGAALKAEADIDANRPPMPLQPFTVELLDMNRGNWTFLDWDGQHLQLPSPAFACAYPPPDAKSLQIRYLLCNPEFPRDPAHGVIRSATPINDNTPPFTFRVREPFFSSDISISRNGSGRVECQLTNITLGSALDGDEYVDAIYLSADGTDFPIWLTPRKADTTPVVRLMTNRVGNIFTGKDEAQITIAGLGADTSQTMELAMNLTDYATGKILWIGTLRLPVNPSKISLSMIIIPLERYGIYELTAYSHGERIADLRLCHIPKPKTVKPDDSKIGINIFQQQIWWYSFQVPMMAAAGVHWIRPWLAWENIWNTQQPQPNRWRTKPLDAALRRMKRYGMRYQDILFQAPQWVAGNAQCGTPPMNRLADWGKYVSRLVSEYMGRIPCYEVWNEPDGMWQTEANRAEHYVALLKTSWLAAKKADPTCKILGLSLAGNLDWLEKVCADGAAKYMDIATFHNYAAPQDFAAESSKRIRILDKFGIHRYWINEFGVTAYDFDSAYSRKYDCSEKNQAITLTENYAQAMAMNPETKAFWFCTYDPRDAAHESGWTSDAGIGILYLGFLPKLAYAALAGYAWMTNGRRCLGMVHDPDIGLRQVSFTGPVSVVWREGRRQFSPLPCTLAGCMPNERIVVRNIFGNRIASGKASEIRLDFAQGPVYVEGSRQMAGMATAEGEFRVQPDTLDLAETPSAELTVTVPIGANVNVTPHPSSDFTLQIHAKSAGKRTIMVVASNPSQRIFGIVEIAAKMIPPKLGLQRKMILKKRIEVTGNGGPDFIEDGAFCRGDLSSWTFQGESSCDYDRKTGHLIGGCLRFIGPFSQRLVQWNVKPEPSKPLMFKCWIKSDHLSNCRITLNLAWFGVKDWVRTSCLATNGVEGKIENGWQTVKEFAHIPSNTNKWTPIEVSLPPPYLPEGADHAAFFIDATGGGSGRIWIDDLDLWQS